MLKPKCKTPFSKLLKVYICYISNIRHSNIRDRSKKYLQKIKDFIGKGDLRKLYKPISRPSKYIFLLCYLLLKKVIENISFNVF